MKPQRFFLLLCLLLATVMVLPKKTFGQPPPPPPPVDTNPTDAPIDGGLTLLLAAGAAYGVKKVREGRKQHTDGEER